MVAAAAVGNVMDREAITTQLAEMQRLALLGQLTRALVHEVNHRLTPISFALDTLKGQCQDIDLALAHAPADAGRALYDAHTNLDDITQAVRGLVNTARLFGGIARSSRDSQVLVLHEIAKEVADLVRDTASKEHVDLRVDAPQQIHITQTQVALAQQILLNIVLNAIQQIGESRPKSGGTVRIWFATGHEDGQRLVNINVEDDGPGIHFRLWEQVFELGYSTRKEGSGLGLHISRSLAKSLGGDVYVAESFIGWGTTFTIKLPLRL